MERKALLYEYFRDAGRHDVLSREEEISLAKRMRENGSDSKDALNTFASSNFRLVISIAGFYKNRGLSFEELVDEGNRGLCYALRKYEYERGSRFSTYASYCIRHFILNAFKKKKSVMKSIDAEFREESASILESYADKRQSNPVDEAISREHIALIRKMMNTLPERERMIIDLRYGLGEDYGKSYTLKEIGEMLSLSRERVRQIQRDSIKKIQEMLVKAESYSVARKPTA